MKSPKTSAGAILALFVLTLIPAPLLAAGCSVSAMDTVAGLGTEIAVQGCAGQSSGAVQVFGPQGTTFNQMVALDASGAASVNVAGKFTEIAGSYSVQFGTARTTFAVLPDAPDDVQSTLSASARSMQPGEQLTVTAVLRDRYENPLPGRPVALLSNRSRDSISPRSSQTDESGRYTWTVRTEEIGAMSLTAYDVLSSRQLSSRLEIPVGNGSTASALRGSALTAQMTGVGQGSIDTDVVDHFEVELVKKGTVDANELFSVVITAVDAAGDRAKQSDREFENHVVQGYVGRVMIEASDPNAEFPKKGQDRLQPNIGWVEFRPMDLGVRSIPLGFVFRAGGKQTITVYDEEDPSVRGELIVQVEKAQSGSNEAISIVSPANNTLIGNREVRVVGKGPVLINIKIKGGAQPVFTETNVDGTFEALVQLPAEYNEATLFASKEDGTNESDPVRLRIDQIAPKVDTIAFEPPEGKTKDPAVVTVLSEPGLKEVVAQFQGKAIPMVETATPGTYQGNIEAAPEQEGMYDLTVDVTDEVGNKGTLLTKWKVNRKTLPVVEGVTAEGQPSSVLVQWKPLKGVEVSEYRIYVAREDDPENFLASVETNAPVTSAILKDLEIGYTYLFSLTAINSEGQESAERSEAAAAAPLGLLLQARSENQSLVLEWNPPSSLPLAHYILEYGTEPGVYTERRTINSSLRSYTIRDLMNEVTYEVRLTPIAVTGKALLDLSAIARGTPGGEPGFHAGTGDPIPDGLFPGAGPDPDYTIDPPIDDVPVTTGSGPGTIMAVAVLILSLLLGVIWRQHRTQKRMTQQFLEMMQHRYHA